jgi:puromycin-sensitive aminopeptidase
VPDPNRLARDARPVRYDLHLRLDPARRTFGGELRLVLEVAKATRQVELNAKGITAQRVAARQGGRRMAGTSAVLAKSERVRLVFDAPLRPGKATLEIGYEGKVSEGMAGLYLSKDGKEACLATQCEATDARAIFPCFDEPDRKAVFALKVTAPKGLTVLGNGAVKSRRTKGRLATWSFAPTKPMATYLFATAVGRFAATKAATARKVPFRVWALAGKHRLGGHARELGTELLPFYEDYFGQPYAFGKYDQVAVPSFAFGAMENAGLVVFRPSLVLLDPKTASWDDRKDVALVVAHEFAHMWFGDLVTMAWWDDLWLNEAFAEWMAHKAVAALHPELDVWVNFRARAAGALATDALERTHAIYHPIRTPAQAAEMFDAVTYGKGSAVMRMIEAYLGEDAFRAGLRRHMKRFRFGNAAGADLWRNLGAASRQDVATIMKDWVGHVGHPAVSCSWRDGKLRLSQHRARASPQARRTRTAWRVPMVIRYEDGAGIHEVRHLLRRRAEAVALPARDTLHWLWANAGDLGFYRCFLDDDLLRLALDHGGRLAPEERIALLRDLWLQVRSGERDVAVFLAAFTRLADGEVRYDVLQHAVGTLRSLERLLELGGRTDALPPLRAWAVRRFGASYRRLGPDARPGDSEPTKERRAALLRAVAGTGRDGQALAEARAMAARERQDPAAVDATVAETAIAIEALAGDGKTLDVHLRTYRRRRDGHAPPQEVERYLYVLPAFRDARLVLRVLARLKTQDVAAQAKGPILRAMLAEPHSQRQAWAHLTKNWARLKKELGESWVAILVEASGEMPPDAAARVRAFWDKHLGGQAQQAYGRAKERLRQNAEFMERVLPGIETWARGLA